MIVKKIKGVVVSFPSEKIMKEILDELNIEEENKKEGQEIK
ncbi:hypothetical protein J5U23_01566 [Saccharolobus shibatae B12]|uniref:Uncharacterized protein n=1 Tax=Saccharolobus shibatae (strain ATCC 51178 / DSM 5389 / JCM 8931 / NBRC 15437 / B12) TaxID=523848 RepID=A0A8F5GTT6_SACSH|nr:hypothetical protein [Saccharolobus shibatae]QXJ28697.1 hypothetical protein J5U23_01566 [Saccharolobus shibatae B12]